MRLMLNRKQWTGGVGIGTLYRDQYRGKTCDRYRDKTSTPSVHPITRGNMMTANEKEIKMLKKLVKAQNTMIMHYKLGKTYMLPEWVFKTFDDAKDFYKINSIQEIK